MQVLTVQPRWLLCLMIFFIGWSRVFAATLEPMPSHHTMPMSVVSVPSESTAQSIPHQQDHLADCSHAKMQHPSSDFPDKPACHQERVANFQHEHCTDCSPSHCQNLNLWLIQPAFDGIAGVLEQPESSHPLPAHVRHLSGYWQEILRPPRT